VKLNWPLIGIGAGAVVTVGVIVTVLTSGGTTISGTSIVTMDQVTAVQGTPADVDATLDVRDNGCFFLSTSDGDLWPVWPEGTTQDGQRIVLPDGSTVADGDAVVATALEAEKSAVKALVGGSGPAAIAEYCLGDDGAVTLVSAAR
jgi:hypothetical protein